MSNIFGGNTGLTYEQVLQRKKIAEQLRNENNSTPRNVGEGLQAIARAFVARGSDRQAAKREGELDAEWKAQVSTMGLDPAREAIYGRLPYGSRDAALLQHMNQQDALRRAGAARGAAAAKAAAQMERTQEIIAALSGGQPQGQPGAPGGAAVSDALLGRLPVQMPGFSMGSPEDPQIPSEPAAPAFVGGSGFMGGFTPEEVAMSQPVVNPQPPMPVPVAPMPVQQPAEVVGSGGPLSFGSAAPEPQEPAPMDARGEIESSLNRAYDMLAVMPDKDGQEAIIKVIKALEGKLSLLPQPVDPPLPPNSVREYEYYVRQTKERGGTPLSYAEWSVMDEKATLPPADPPADIEELRKKLGGKEGEQWAGYLERGAKSAGMMQDLTLLGELTKLAPQGPITGRLAQAFPGFNSAASAYQSIVKRVAPTMRAEGSGSTSDIEFNGMVQSLPQLLNNPAANDLIIGMMTAKAEIDQERAAIVAEFQNSDDPNAAKKARTAMHELNSRSIMTPELTALMQGVAPVVAPDDDGPVYNQETGKWE